VNNNRQPIQIREAAKQLVPLPLGRQILSGWESGCKRGSLCASLKP